MFDAETHVGEYREVYGTESPLLFGFDFNVDPGVAIVAQIAKDSSGEELLVVIGEVYIAGDSDTWRVCEALIDRWGDHKGEIHLHGDATGVARQSCAKETNWSIVEEMMGKAFPGTPGQPRVLSKYAKNPREVDRVNTVNALLMNADGYSRMFVDLSCSWLVRDMEGVRWRNGKLDKSGDLTHISDPVGYIACDLFPIVRLEAKTTRRTWR
jgi:hypothetical protein